MIRRLLHELRLRRERHAQIQDSLELLKRDVATLLEHQQAGARPGHEGKPAWRRVSTLTMLVLLTASASLVYTGIWAVNESERYADQAAELSSQAFLLALQPNATDSHQDTAQGIQQRAADSQDRAQRTIRYGTALLTFSAAFLGGILSWFVTVLAEGRTAATATARARPRTG